MSDTYYSSGPTTKKCTGTDYRNVYRNRLSKRPKTKWFRVTSVRYGI